jgi:hypothetical protein
MRIAIAFRQFHYDNPHVYHALVMLARNLKKKGHQTYGMKSLFEVLRWEYAMKTTGSAFKLNNNYTSMYARLIMQNEPDLQEFFRIRKFSPQIIE